MYAENATKTTSHRQQRNRHQEEEYPFFPKVWWLMSRGKGSHITKKWRGKPSKFILKENARNGR